MTLACCKLVGQYKNQYSDHIFSFILIEKRWFDPGSCLYSVFDSGKILGFDSVNEKCCYWQEKTVKLSQWFPYTNR